jgi:hypothetical protein
MSPRPQRTQSGFLASAPRIAPPIGRNYSHDMDLQIGLPEASRRAFWARLYARRRLLSERAAPFAAAHYALIGEKLGYRPNGFFDPHYFRKHASGARSGSRGLLELYLAQPEANALSPSAEFDRAWYVSQNPDWSRSHPHPFLHFLEDGLRNGRRPRPDIDLEFLRDVIRGKGRSLEEAAFRVFDRAPREGEWSPPLNRQEMRARQDRFFAAGRLRIERESKPTGRRLLVYVQSGRGFDAAYLRPPRAYDLLLNYYDESPPCPSAETVVYQRGSKNTSIRRLLELRPDLLLRYDRVLFLDDDIEIGAAQIDLLFRAAEREKLDLAGPALTSDSQTAWPFLKQPAAGDGIMRVSSIEIMAPLITRRALEAAGWVFAESASGWGSDLLLGPAVRSAFGPESVGVIGSVAVRHARPVDTRSGTLYLYLRSYGIETGHEANRIAFDFGVDRFLRPLAPGETGPICRGAQRNEHSLAHPPIA